MQDSIRLRCVRAAVRGDYFEDFKTSARLSTEAGAGFEAIMTALHQLFDEGTIKVSDRRMALSSESPPTWFSSLIDHGDPLAWEISSLSNLWKPDYSAQQEQLSRIGFIGEEFVLGELERFLPIEVHSRIRHVSIYNDAAGYDLTTPSIANNSEQLHVEVKTSSKPGGSIEFFLTRNEFERALIVTNWRLVLVRINPKGLTVAGHLHLDHLQPALPVDTSKNSMWTVARCTVKSSDLIPGLP